MIKNSKKNTAAPLYFTKFCLSLSLVLSFFTPAPFSAETPRPNLESFFAKKEVTIAVTDSGLGGLSVMAEAARRMKDAGIFEQVDFIFFNALFSSEGGYNSLETREEKIQIFSSALESLQKKYHPNIILIGCNTLSVLYAATPFAHKTKTPVIDIVDPGVDLIAQGLRAHPEASVIIFGTPTTIAEGAHKAKLLEQGFGAQRIVTQSCPELESFIERDYAGAETGMLISGCVSEALAKVPSPPPPLFASLNCTHYGYALPFWEKAFEEAGVQPLGILNPNFRMTDLLFRPEYLGRYKKTEVNARIVSMVAISPEKIDSLGRWLQAISPEIADALRRYQRIPSLFEWKKFIR
jgi:glutamate racemase